jgi:ribosome-binding factor A
MLNKRVPRLNSLLKEVISEVIHREVKNPHVHHFVSVTSVDISSDLQHAKVFISVIGTKNEKEETIKALQSAAGFIAIAASKKVVMRYFPELTFKLDDSVDKQIRIDSLLEKIHEEQQARKPDDDRRDSPG